jgi:hypothetical protein
MAVISQFTHFALHSHTTTPVGNITPVSIGDLCIRSDTGSLYTATTLVNTGWQEVSATSFTAVGNITWLLNDNNAAALDIGSTGATNLLRFVTTNGTEQLEYRGGAALEIITGGLEVDAGNVVIAEGLLPNLAVAVADYAVNTLVPTFTIATDHGGGNADQAFTLPARTGGWRLIDAYVRSTAGTGGNLTLKDAAGGNAMTDAIVPGNANVITRAAQIIVGEQVAASGSTPVWDGAASTPATTCYSVWMGL